MDNPFYIRKKAAFLIKNDDVNIETFIYQPTPMGVDLLCQHYNKKYEIDLRAINLMSHVEDPTDCSKFFSYLQRNPSLLDVNEGQARGLVLGHGQFHTIPVLVCKKDNVQHLVVFDSNSGCRVKGYFGIASLFPEAQVHLNSGTRQADDGSCITDAICILKEALQIENLVELIISKRITEPAAFKPGRFFKGTLSAPANLHLFKMPERLLVTAQISKYVTEAEADLSVIVRGEHTLGHYRDTYVMQVSLSKADKIIDTGINSYLYRKAYDHKCFFDAHLKFLDDSALDDSVKVASAIAPSLAAFVPIEVVPTENEEQCPRSPFSR